MTKITGTVKWFSSRKGFGFVAPTSDNAPSKDEIFVHHSGLQMVEGAYRTVAEGTEVEFETEKDENGKLKAVNVTGVGGAPLVPPKREKRRQRKPKKDAEGSGGEVGEIKNSNGGKGRQNGRKEKEPVKKEPPFHDVIKPEIRTKITDKGIKLVRNTVDISLGGSRVKLGQGGYASLVDANGMIGEGSYTCDENAKVVFAWERCLEFTGGKWQKADASKLVASLSLTDDGVSPVKPDETPESLWGNDKPDPKDLFTEHGFKMKKVILTRPTKTKHSRSAEGAKSE
jgi:cold shock CspA family protein